MRTSEAPVSVVYVRRADNYGLIRIGSIFLMIKLASIATRPVRSAAFENLYTTNAQWFVAISAAVAAIFTQF